MKSREAPARILSGMPLDDFGYLAVSAWTDPGRRCAGPGVGAWSAVRGVGERRGCDAAGAWRFGTSRSLAPDPRAQSSSGRSFGDGVRRVLRRTCSRFTSVPDEPF